MFNKTFLVALILCACYFGASWARPSLIPVPVPGLDGLPVGNLGQVAGPALAAAAAAAAGSLAGGALASGLPVGGAGKLL